jgi:hypothetical protein
MTGNESKSVTISFTGSGLEIGLDIPTVDWSRTPTLSFSLNKKWVE